VGTFPRKPNPLAVGRSAPHPLGLALFDESLPQMWVLNQLHVVGPRPELDGPGLVAELDRLYPDVAHRQVTVTDDGTGARLSEQMQLCGFSAERDGVMLLETPPDPPAPGIARQADEESFRAAELAIAQEDPVWASVAELLMDGRARLRAARPHTRAFLGRHDGIDVSTVTMHADGHTAQLEDVATRVAHRRHGVAGATLALAAREALAAGHDLVFLLVDVASGPVPLYERLGFRVAGHKWVFTRSG
jgi:GNAT superfamily N-acetyltransferase